MAQESPEPRVRPRVEPQTREDSSENRADRIRAEMKLDHPWWCKCQRVCGGDQ